MIAVWFVGCGRRTSRVGLRKRELGHLPLHFSLSIREGPTKSFLLCASAPKFPNNCNPK